MLCAVVLFAEYMGEEPKRGHLKSHLRSVFEFMSRIVTKLKSRGLIEFLFERCRCVNPTETPDSYEAFRKTLDNALKERGHIDLYDFPDNIPYGWLEDQKFLTERTNR